VETQTTTRTVTSDIVAKLWNLCNILKDDGVTYHQYVIELTYMLFLKMAKETGVERQLPEGFRWGDLEATDTADRLAFYKQILNHLGNEGSSLVKEIFAGAISFIKKSNTLSALVTEIDKLEWYSVDREGLGDIYEGLLEKDASDKKSGAGQYFTPRPLIESIVAVMKPTIDDIIQDPAAGTCGFLIAAARYIQEHSKVGSWTKEQQRKYKTSTFYGMEHVQDTYRLGLMNLFLHSIESDPSSAGLHYGDTLSPEHQKLPKETTLFLSNPPFGSKKGAGIPERPDFPFPTSNKQFCFLQHIYLGLQLGGRAAVVVPDNVLFEGNVGKQIRTDLMDKCNLHTILRLPSGIFYAQGVKTNVLFFTRGKKDTMNTQNVWVYDMRAHMPAFGQRLQLAREDFTDFEIAFGKDPLGRPAGLSHRTDTGVHGRFRRFTREWIAERSDSLDISWLKSESREMTDELSEPALLAQEALGELEAATKELHKILQELGSENH
jgi:type I restriction enzyme M protein